jgi:hypothetical protein
MALKTHSFTYSPSTEAYDFSAIIYEIPKLP